MGSPGTITFAKCDVDKNQQIASSLGVTALPTFLMLKDGKEANRVQGANIALLQSEVRKLVSEDGPSTPSGSGETAVWIGNEIPKPYSDVTGQTDLKQLDLLNSMGNVRVLFDSSKPSQAALANSKKGKGNEAGEGGDGKAVQDWVESDTDEQLMLFMSFNSIIKVHTIQITSLAPPPGAEEDGDDDDDEVPSRPGVLKIWANHPQILSFDEGEDKEPTQLIELKTADWNLENGTISVPLRFVKFQSVSTINILFVEAEKEDAEKVRVDRIRIIGGTGEKKEMGKLEKIGDLSGE